MTFVNSKNASQPTWQPTASITHLRERARVIKCIREFFWERGVWEVETPALSHATVTDPNLHSFSVEVPLSPQYTKSFYLQTSPEFAMKRLLAAGSGDIFQITKAFRRDELGQRHNPEFTMLEWYRLNFDQHDLMNEISALIQDILGCAPAQKQRYRDLFWEYLQLDPFTCTLATLQTATQRQNLMLHRISDTEKNDRDFWLYFLMSHCIEPKLGKETPLFVYDFPPSQAALARLYIDKLGQKVAARFELYCSGMEIANGFHELTHPEEQRTRFEEDLKIRQSLGLECFHYDAFFIEALQAGLPECSGVALGIDRLIMLALKQNDIAQVMAFTMANA